MRRLVAHLRDSQGFTLMEMVVVLPMATLILGGAVAMLTTLIRANGQTNTQAIQQTEARAMLDRFDGELRQAFDGTGTWPVLAATATSITFESPDRSTTTVSGSTETSFHLQKITYSVNSSTGALQRQAVSTTNTFPPTNNVWTWPGTTPASQPILTSVANSDVFTYYSALGGAPTQLSFPISDTSLVAIVKIKLQLSTGGTQGRTTTYTDEVAIRETADK